MLHLYWRRGVVRVFNFETLVWHAAALRFNYNKLIRLLNLFMYDKIGDDKMRNSENWKHWIAEIDEKICRDCKEKYGMIYSTDEIVIPEPPIHPFCRCRIELLLSAEAGSLTSYGTAGADWFIKYLQKLPDNCLTIYDAETLGWVRKKGNLAEVAPGYQIFGGVYKNRNGYLPQKEGRIWYEADLNYTSGFRNGERLVFSNDGLIFATGDHYKTFIEVV